MRNSIQIEPMILSHPFIMKEDMQPENTFTIQVILYFDRKVIHYRIL